MLDENFEDLCVRKLSNYLKSRIISLPIEVKIDDAVTKTGREDQFNHTISFVINHNKDKKDSAHITKLLTSQKQLNAEYTDYISNQVQGKFTFTKNFAVLNKRPGYFMIDRIRI